MGAESMTLTASPACIKANFALIATSLAFLYCAACSTTEVQSFNVPKARSVESAQIAADADFSKYDRLLAQDMGIYYSPKANVSQDDIARLRKAFHDAFTDELQNYAIVKKPGPSTMTVEASLIDLRGTSGSDLPTLRYDIRQVAKSGSLVFLMEMKDSMTGKVLARAADSAQAPALATSEGVQTDWKAVDDAARHWAGLFRQFLDDNLHH
jgi:Protein of unknown function (DUF3313)